MKKAYIVLFTCCATRAKYLELVQDLSIFTFVNCFRKFCARRGTQRLVNSDNAKTSKAADKFLMKLAKDETFSEFLESRTCLLVGQVL